MIKESRQNIAHMEYAVRLAKKALGQTHPNPMVGAGIVEGGKVVAEGYHQKSGEKHAEIIALDSYTGTPKADTTMSAALVISAKFWVRLCVSVTVAFPGLPLLESKILIGRPTI